ncbi:hypothetical protein [Streptomyces sp. UH6]|uniref:hypothetical protein n=1 Tax=Streptomyces sp. UH6 TaxID=2748379 RepID=UPI0015D478F2|nr:hypothetical protein [Streptomyces sp. UH6]NYV73126.1 hypothetical protein [Streptomyces sp. UH6]
MTRIRLDDMTSQQLDDLYRKAERSEAALERVRQAARIADDEDVTDWQRGYRACASVVLAALAHPEQAVPAPAVTEDACPTPMTHNWGCGCPTDQYRPDPRPGPAAAEAASAMTHPCTGAELGVAHAPHTVGPAHTRIHCPGHQPPA